MKKDEDGNIIKRDTDDPLGIQDKTMSLLRAWTRKNFSVSGKGDGDPDLEGGSKGALSITKSEKERNLKKELLVGYQTGSIFGGALSIIGAAIMAFFAIDAFLTIWEGRETDFVGKINIYNEQRRPNEPVLLGSYENSLHFIFGLSNWDPTFDVQNNPYVRFQGFEFNSNGPKIMIDEKYDLDLCTPE